MGERTGKITEKLGQYTNDPEAVEEEVEEVLAEHGDRGLGQDSSSAGSR